MRLQAARALETGEGVLLRLLPGLAITERDPLDGVIVSHNPCLSGGALEIFLDPQPVAPRIAIVGDTPIARALAAIARAAGYDVGSGLQADDAALVVASHGEDEEERLAAALEAGTEYIALVASPKRGARGPGVAGRGAALARAHPRRPGHRRSHSRRHRDLDPRPTHRPAHRHPGGGRRSRRRPTRSAAWRSWPLTPPSTSTPAKVASTSAVKAAGRHTFTSFRRRPGRWPRPSRRTGSSRLRACRRDGSRPCGPPRRASSGCGTCSRRRGAASWARRHGPRTDA